MRFKNFVFSTAAAALIGTAAVAADQAVIDRIVADFKSEGQAYTNIKVQISPFSVEVEATGPGIKVERSFDLDGNLRKEEIRTANNNVERKFNKEGSIVSERTRADDDDDDRADDRDDDRGGDDDRDDDDDRGNDRVDDHDDDDDDGDDGDSDDGDDD